MAIIKVLCAEDDRLMRLEMKEKMTAKGWEVIEAVDGKEALVKYKKYRPDIVVLDVNMPKRSGLEVLQLIRVNDLQTPVVIYSSLAEEKDLKIGLCQGAQVYLVKNYSVALLLEQVERLIGKTASSVIGLTDNITYDFAKAELCIGAVSYTHLYSKIRSHIRIQVIFMNRLMKQTGFLFGGKVSEDGGQYMPRIITYI